jgi:serine/threonine-protein kinase RsbT
VPIDSDADLVKAREAGRLLAREIGLSSTEATLVATAISELARNIVLYAGRGEIVLRRVAKGARLGLEIVARDSGPGIANVALAASEGYSTSGGLGLGLPGVRRIMDEFHVDSRPPGGTTVTACKWRP